MSPEWFYFKGFKVAQGDVGLKINTDAILLGAWIKHITSEKALEVGAGTGVISCIYGHFQAHTQIDAIEIESNAFQLCQRSFEFQQNNGLKAFHQNFLALEKNSYYDFIFSNPPYFNSHPGDSSRSVARQQKHLDPPSFFEKCSAVSTPEAKLAVVLPISVLETWNYHALINAWYPVKKCTYSDTPNKAPSRALLLYQKSYHANLREHFYLFELDGTPSSQLKFLTEDIYLDLKGRGS
ncbi:MAG: tRNA1(Val) (adenine(37)-N6)-methyltransferase [Luteibaculum sp.]